jgi:hypothetical protein
VESGANFPLLATDGKKLLVPDRARHFYVGTGVCDGTKSRLLGSTLVENKDEWVDRGSFLTSPLAPRGELHP